MPKLKTVFACQSCGYQSPKWLGRCPECEAWNSLAEERLEASPTLGGGGTAALAEAKPVRLDEITLHERMRIASGIGELDRVLGGGLVPGSVVLVGGEPGIGKSTLLLWAMGQLGEQGVPVLYVSGEESLQQTKLRATRLGTRSEQLYFVSETHVESILQAIEQVRPQVVVIDSIQVLYRSDLTSSPGSVSQVRECANALVRVAKSAGTALLLVGHVTKDGSLAGPKVLEHLVDTVLTFEGDPHAGFRILRASKNRFGATSEIGVFQMTGRGLEVVDNPSASFLAERSAQVPGSMVTASLEGTRPLLIEIQALACPTHFGLPQRRMSGVDMNRVHVLLAVLERRVGLQGIATHDVYVSASGGATVIEPAADLAIAIAVASSLKERPTRSTDCALGEVGLSGELRSLLGAETRLTEAKRLGFTRCLISRSSVRDLRITGMEIVAVSSVQEAIAAALERP
ncbi:MAG: DNA repair protein RadA [Candidatus Omnitrophica bacterium]|nr:DNA repair protein RadA [Candidatus Omnitrophota bacterium]